MLADGKQHQRWRRAQAMGIGASMGGSIPHLAQQRHALTEEEGNWRNGKACFSYWSWVLPLFHDGAAGALSQAMWPFVGKSCQYVEKYEAAAWAQ